MAATVLREWQHAGDSFQLTERDKKLSAKGRSLRLIAFAAALLDIPEQHLGDGTNALHDFSWTASLINAILALDGIGEDDFKAGKRKTTGDWLSATEGESSTGAADPYAKIRQLAAKKSQCISHRNSAGMRWLLHGATGILPISLPKRNRNKNQK